MHKESGCSPDKAGRRARPASTAVRIRPSGNPVEQDIRHPRTGALLERRPIAQSDEFELHTQRLAVKERKPEPKIASNGRLQPPGTSSLPLRSIALSLAEESG